MIESQVKIRTAFNKLWITIVKKKRKSTQQTLYQVNKEQGDWGFGSCEILTTSTILDNSCTLNILIGGGKCIKNSNINVQEI